MGLFALLLFLAAWGLAGAQEAEDSATSQSANRVVVPGIRRAPEPTPTPTPEPRVLERSVIGSSLQGRDIEAFGIGEGPVTIVLIGGIHTGIESESVHLVQDLRDHIEDNPGELPRGMRVVFVPNANPDGYASGDRLNARGVDLNRNWPADNWQPDAVHGSGLVDGGSAPLSEPETRAVHDLLLELQPAFILSYHGYAGLLEDNGVSGNGQPGAFDLTRAYAGAADYEHIREWDIYEITGQLIDAMEEEGIAAADVELVYRDATSFDRNLAGLRAVFAALE